jgi:hypothetical protein
VAIRLQEERGFCARCGSTLTWGNPNLPGETHSHIGAFERAAELTLTGALLAEERVPWFDKRSGPFDRISALVQVALKRDPRGRD